MKRLLWIAIPVLYLVVPILLKGNNYILSLTVASLIIAGVAVAWALLGNLGGMVSFGHAAFFGLGSYASALLSMKAGVPVALAIPLGGVFAAVASLAMLPALRLSGPYFALAILAYAQIFRILATEFTSLTGGSGGISSIPGLPSLVHVEFFAGFGPYLTVLTIVLAFCAIYGWVRKSDYGIALRAMHDSEDATRVVGVNSVLLKSWMLLLSAFMTGTIGAFNAHVINFLEPDYAFNGIWSVLWRLSHHHRSDDRRGGDLLGRPAGVQGGARIGPPDRARHRAGCDDPVRTRRPARPVQETQGGRRACLSSTASPSSSAA